MCSAWFLADDEKLSAEEAMEKFKVQRTLDPNGPSQGCTAPSQAYLVKCFKRSLLEGSVVDTPRRLTKVLFCSDCFNIC